MLQQHQSASIDADASYSPTTSISQNRTGISSAAAHQLTLDLATAPESRSCSPHHQIDHDTIISTVITEDQENTVGSITEDFLPEDGGIELSPSRPDELCVDAVPTAGDGASPIHMAITPTITVMCPVGDEPGTDESPADPIESTDELALELNASPEQMLVPSNADPDTLYGTMDELSPTTEEYQECCAPDDFQLEGEIMAPGCVAPAPTPAPSIAPLAEVEGDPADDDDAEPDESAQRFGEAPVEELIGCTAPSSVGGAIEPIVVIQTVATVVAPTKRHHHRKKRNAEGSEGGSPGVGKEASVSRQHSEEVAGHNTVCPWEDE